MLATACVKDLLGVLLDAFSLSLGKGLLKRLLLDYR